MVKKESFMDTFLDILLDSFLDTCKLIPLLFFVYFLIELLEFKNVFRFEKSRLLTGKFSPLLGSVMGIVPQCGFSVISAELYSERKMSLAALLAVFLATSDEAFPILISNYKSIPVLLVLLLVKLIIALIVGYAVYFIYDVAYLNKPRKAHHDPGAGVAESSDHHGDDHHDEHDEHGDHHNHGDEHRDTDENEAEHEHRHLHACCHHEIEDTQKFNWQHPLIHCFKISLYIFIVNFLLTGLVTLIGEERISDFLAGSSALQPLFALFVGFIPNCASSVILTELFMRGMISFGAVVTGLCANAGIGLFVLFKQNKSTRQNLAIVTVLVLSSLVFGYILHFIPFKLI